VVDGAVSVTEVLAVVGTSSVVEGDSVDDSVVVRTSVDSEVTGPVVEGDSVDDSVVPTSVVDSEVAGTEVDSAEELDADTSETGHTVVETAITEVTTAVEPAGQFTTVGAQLVMVATEVV
jgi:hypothetical protein